MRRQVISAIGGLVFLLLASPVTAATVTAQSCSEAHVAAAIAAAGNGGTVTVPVGTCAWTTGVTINTGITLRGAGIDQTIITDAKVRVNGAGVLVAVNIPQGQSFRLTGFTFRGDGVQGPAGDGTITLSGCSTTTADYRIDHNKFQQLYNVGIKTYGSLFGLSDHNTGTGHPSGTFHLLNLNNITWPRNGISCTGKWADGSWAAAIEPGTIKAHYVEDNTWDGGGSDSAQIIDSNFGARTVLRYNTIINTGVGSHGTDSGQRFRGQRWLEIYNNVMTYPAGRAVDMAIWIRGGSGVVFNNRVTVDRQAGFNWYVKHLNLRSNDPRVFPPFGKCDGTAVWDGNSGDASGAGFRCLDQPGAGTSVDFNDTDTPPNIKASNALQPIYVWNNQVNGMPENCGNLGCISDGVVVNARDIIHGQAAPAYTPFTYPHPLTAGANVKAPSAPPTPDVK